MSLDTTVTIIFAVLAVVSYVGYRVSSERVYLKFKEQKVGK